MKEDDSYKNIFKNLGPEPLIKGFSVQDFYENLNIKTIFYKIVTIKPKHYLWPWQHLCM